MKYIELRSEIVSIYQRGLGCQGFMIADPILRISSELVEQLENLQPLKATDIKLGAHVFMAVIIKKVLFTDNLAPRPIS